jgi:hypothetical protein
MATLRLRLPASPVDAGLKILDGMVTDMSLA